jgi:hypothetical protein
VKISRFNANLDANGATAENWPDREREAALTLARSSVVAARALADARRLDDALKAYRSLDVAADPARLNLLRSRIIAAAAPRSNSWAVRWFGFDPTPAQFRHSLAGLAVVALLGFGVGAGAGGLIQIGSEHDSEDLSTLTVVDLPNSGSN